MQPNCSRQGSSVVRFIGSSVLFTGQSRTDELKNRRTEEPKNRRRYRAGSARNDVTDGSPGNSTVLINCRVAVSYTWMNGAAPDTQRRLPSRLMLATYRVRPRSVIWVMRFFSKSIASNWFITA